MQDWTPEKLQTEIESGKKVFLKLWKKGCGACKLSEPALDRLEQEFGSTVTFGQICMDDHEEMYEVTGTDVLPVFYVFDGQSKKGEVIGFKGIQKLKDLITA